MFENIDLVTIAWFLGISIALIVIIATTSWLKSFESLQKMHEKEETEE